MLSHTIPIVWTYQTDFETTHMVSFKVNLGAPDQTLLIFRNPKHFQIRENDGFQKIELSSKNIKKRFCRDELLFCGQEIG